LSLKSLALSAVFDINIALANIANIAQYLEVLDYGFAALTPRHNMIDMEFCAIMWGSAAQTTARTISHQY